MPSKTETTFTCWWTSSEVEICATTFANTADSPRNRPVRLNTDLFKNLGFFIACIISGLEYTHNKNILHRDIKPENIVLDEEGKPIWITSSRLFLNFQAISELLTLESHGTGGLKMLKTPRELRVIWVSSLFTDLCFLSSSGSYVQAKSRSFRRLFRCWCDCFWMYVWKTSICGKVEKRNPRPHIIQINLNSKTWSSQRMVCTSSWLYK